MNKKPAWIISAIFLSFIFIYAITYLTSRKAELSHEDGVWVVYFYNKSYVRQYALDADARELFNLTMKTGTRSFLAGYEGDVGKDWFCVYIKPDSQYYRIFRLAEEIENLVLRARSSA